MPVNSSVPRVYVASGLPAVSGPQTLGLHPCPTSSVSGNAAAAKNSVRLSGTIVFKVDARGLRSLGRQKGQKGLSFDVARFPPIDRG